MTKTISFIHAADLHLDSPFQGLTKIPETIFQEVRNSTFAAFDQLVQTAITKQVDFILLIGDLFDNEKQSLKAQVRLRQGFKQLQQVNIQVYLSYGNHDFLLGNPYRLDFPENVHVFSSESVTHFTFEKNGEPCANIYGFSYHERAVRQNKITEYQLENTAIPYHIATLHGTLHGNHDHDPYAPFTLQQLQATPFDYWALGHIHVRAELSSHPPIIYPGNIQGRHRNESGDKGCYYVKMTPTDTFLTFTSLQSIEFIQTEIDMTQCYTLDDIEKALLSVVEKTGRKQLIHLTILCNQSQGKLFEQEHVLSEMMEVVNAPLMEEEIWQYIFDFRVQVNDIKEFVVEDLFVEELEQALADVKVTDVVADLFKHPVARKYLRQMDEASVKLEAKEILHQSLSQTEESDML